MDYYIHGQPCRECGNFSRHQHGCPLVTAPEVVWALRYMAVQRIYRNGVLIEAQMGPFDD